jgi:hypothetical protein
MTPQENQVLQKFLTQLAQAQVSTKDPDAQAMISTALAQQPDAAYLLVQRALLLEQALQQAKSQLAQLQEQRDPVAGGNRAASQAWPSTAGAAPAPVSAPQAQPAPQVASTSSGWGSFLGTAASTAAGVAGGAFLFQGLEGLLGHHGGGFLGGSGPTETVENITINEYPADADLETSAPDSDLTDSSDDDAEFDPSDNSDDELGEDDVNDV